MISFLANENFPKPGIALIRSQGFPVVSVAESHSGISDSEVIELALLQDLIILTFDKDYGEIIFKERISTPPAVVFFRYKGADTQFSGNVICKILIEGKVQLKHHFTVIEESGIRQRRYR